MKKQINPTIKAHLIRGAFYLLLLIAVCAIPFALAQRSSTKRGAANPASNPNMAAKLAAAPPASGAAQATRLAGVRSKAAYDVRGVPDLPLMSQAPQNTSGARAAHVIPRLGPPRAPQVILYDQYDNAGLNATLSATFTDFPTFDGNTADDFVVPGGQTWNVESIDADGVYF